MKRNFPTPYELQNLSTNRVYHAKKRLSVSTIPAEREVARLEYLDAFLFYHQAVPAHIRENRCPKEEAELVKLAERCNDLMGLWD